MIRRFRCRDTEAIFRRQPTRRFPATIHRVALRKLVVLDSAASVGDLRTPPGNHLEKLHGDREGQYSIRVNDQWRICFRWADGGAYDVEIADYH